jgi:myosin-3
MQEVRGSESVCKIILDKVGLKGWRLGKSRVFLRYFHEEKLQLLLKDMEDKAVLIQRIFRGWSTRKR